MSPVPTIAELAKKMEVQNSLLDPSKSMINPLSELQPDKHSRRDSLESTPLPPSLPPKTLTPPTSNVLTGKDLKVTATPPTSSSGGNTGPNNETSLPLSAQILDPNAPSS